MRGVILITILFIIGLSNAPSNYIDDSNALDIVNDTYHSDLQLFQNEAEELYQASKSYQADKINETAFQRQVTATRLAYKKVEFVLDFLDPEFAVKYINGAPLPKVMPKVPELTVVPPTGLQTIDETAFLSPQEKQDLHDLCKALLKNVRLGVQYQSKITLNHRQVLEAARYSVIRIYTLGLTGFDTPGSGNAIEESRVAYQVLDKTLSAYQSLAEQYNLQLEFSKLLNSVKDASQYLVSNTDFETFDRMEFFKQFTLEQYRAIYDLQKKLGIEMINEVNPNVLAHNYDDLNFFDASFFNAAYYTKIASSDLNNEAIVSLGKTLFYDPILSKDVNLSCASCHHPEKAFTDGLTKSNTTNPHMTTERNAPSLVNSALYGRYFWDMREYNLERQIKHVVANELEFNIDFIDLSDRLKESQTYKDLFQAAYGDRDKYGISTWSISNALATYVNSLNSFDSDFDRYMRGETDNYTAAARNGYNLFMGKAACGTCHFAPSFSGIVPPYFQDSESEVLGVTTDFDTINPQLDSDPGRIANGITEEEAPFFAHSFKTMTVRNIELSAPYMHNGAFETLEEVIHFYNHGGGAGLGLDIENQTLPDSKLDLSSQEMNDIVSFLKTLTNKDYSEDLNIVLPKFEQHPEWNDRHI